MPVVAAVIYINQLSLLAVLAQNLLHNQAKWASGRDAALRLAWCGGVRGPCDFDGCVNSISAAAKSNTIHYRISLSLL